MVDPNGLRERAQADAELAYKLREFDGIVRIGPAGDQLDIQVTGGRTTDVRVSDGATPTVTVSAPRSFWEGAIAEVPAPGFESATAGLLHGFTVEGDWHRDVAPYQGAWGRLVTLMRDAAVGHSTEVPHQDDPFADTDDPEGRYVRYTVDGVQYRVYYESAGRGDIPVVLVHTAGADSRQYRHVLADPDLQAKYRLIALDLPYHGKSLPPTSVRWWEEKYSPGMELLMGWVVGAIDAIGLDRPIFVGCSVGGQLASDMCAHHPDKIRAAIGLNGLHNMRPFEGVMDNDRFRDPRVPTEYFGAINFGATSPLAPEPFKRELYWIYKANFPGVYAGDNDYYGSHDLTGKEHLIDTRRTPLLMLTGEYDASEGLNEVNGRKVAETVEGATYTVMTGVGHFAPSDDPVRFRKWFNPALDEAVARSEAATASA